MKKHLHIRFNSPVVLGFITIALIATISGIMTQGNTTYLFFSTYRSSIFNPMMYIRLLTHVFGHSGWEHFLGNASYLLLIGPLLEEKYGSKTIAQMILVTAVITGIINNVFFPNVLLCGASGVVFAFILMASFTDFKRGEIPVTFILVAVIYIGSQIIDGIMLKDNISNTAHIIGGIAGSFFGYQLNARGNRR